jgi:hypothetical protein
MQDIEKRLVEVTIGQLLKDSPKYRKQVLDAVKNRRERGSFLPSQKSDTQRWKIGELLKLMLRLVDV